MADATPASGQPVRTVSIALTTYNGARFLREQLDSFAAQTRLPDELVVGDDGSRDDTVALLREFAASAPFPVRITVNRPNLGAGANFMATANRCAGDVLFFSDQDDRWHPEKVARMLAVLDSEPGRWLALHDAELMDAGGRCLGITLAGQIAAAGQDPLTGHISGCCMALDARLVRLFDPVPHARLHDSWIGTIARHLDLICYTPDVLIDYRRHGSNVSESYVAATRPASRLSRWRERAGKALREPVEASLLMSQGELADATAAMRRHRATLELVVSARRIDAAVAHCETELARVRRRLAVHQAGRGKATASVLQCLCNGDYRGGNGKLSLLRDLASLARRKTSRVSEGNGL